MAAKLPSAILALADLFGLLPGVPFTTATLSGAHTNAVATITLTATVPTNWPTAGAVYIDDECITYTGKSGATLTGATRGAQGTTAASHTDQATVRCGITKGTVNQIIEDLIALSRMAAVPARETWTGATTVDWSDTTKSYNRWAQLTGNVTITLSNPPTRGAFQIELEQDGTGSRTITWATTIKWTGGTTPTWSTAAGKKDLVNLIYDGTDWLGTASVGH